MTSNSRYESARSRFLGLGQDAFRAPKALLPGTGKGLNIGLSGTVGATLDPIMALQREIDLQPGQTVQLAFLTLAADSRAKLLDMAGRYQTWPAIEHAIGQARSRAELELRQLSLSTVELERIQTLLSALLYPQPGLRAASATLAANTRGQMALWAYGISGDYPILLVRIATEDGLPVIHELLQAHAYWRKRGLKVDLVILDQQQAGYNDDLREQIHRLLTLVHSDIWLNQHGGIFILNAGQMAETNRTLVEAAARVVLEASQTGLAAQLDALPREPEPLPPFAPERPNPWRTTKSLFHPWSARQTWPSIMGWEDSVRTAVSTCSISIQASSRRPPGSMWWPTRSSASWCPSRAAATPGR